MPGSPAGSLRTDHHHWLLLAATDHLLLKRMCSREAPGSTPPSDRVLPCSPHTPFSGLVLPLGDLNTPQVSLLAIFPLHSYCPPESSLMFKQMLPKSIFIHVAKSLQHRLCYNLHWIPHFIVLVPPSPRVHHVYHLRFLALVRKQDISLPTCPAKATTAARFPLPGARGQATS